MRSIRVPDEDWHAWQAAAAAAGLSVSEWMRRTLFASIERDTRR
jgi:predicted HicB family RNase H-like nuclease